MIELKIDGTENRTPNRYTLEGCGGKIQIENEKTINATFNIEKDRYRNALYGGRKDKQTKMSIGWCKQIRHVEGATNVTGKRDKNALMMMMLKIDLTENRERDGEEVMWRGSRKQINNGDAIRRTNY